MKTLVLPISHSIFHPGGTGRPLLFLRMRSGRLLSVSEVDDTAAALQWLATSAASTATRGCPGVHHRCIHLLSFSSPEGTPRLWCGCRWNAAVCALWSVSSVEVSTSNNAASIVTP